jgi:uncharacterized protein (TIGR02118 family)
MGCDIQCLGKGRRARHAGNLMIAAISLMRRQDNISLSRFRRHWLDVHGPLVCAFPGLRRYAQCHVIDSLAANEAGLTMRIDGFPILYFDDDAERSRAHGSPEMAACNVDSRQFVGAVSRVIADVSGKQRSGPGRFSLIEIWPEGVSPSAPHAHYEVREQGAAPNSTIPHLPVSVGTMTQTWYDSLVDLECAAAELGDAPSARFAVEEHWLL